MKLTEQQIIKILNKCGYESNDQVKEDAMNQLAKVIISNMQVQQPREFIPYGYSSIKSGPSKNEVHDFNDYEYIQRSYENN